MEGVDVLLVLRQQGSNRCAGRRLLRLEQRGLGLPFFLLRLVGRGGECGAALRQRRLEPVLAAADGVVLACGLAVPGEPEQSYGMMVVIAHTRTLATLYAHLENEVAPPVVTPGQVVKRGQIIGYIGMTGLTTGPHLHFEVRVSGQVLNPRDFLPAA